MANGFRDLYLIEKQANQTFANVKTDDFGLKISTGNLNSFIIGSSGNFINSGIANSLIFGQGPNIITAGSAFILDSTRSIVTGGGAGTIIGGAGNGIGVSGNVGVRDCFNLIAGGCRNTINTAGSRNIILGGGINRIGNGGELYLFANGSVNPSALSDKILNDNGIIAGNHNEINGARRSIIFGGYYNCMGLFRSSTSACNVVASNIFNGLCNNMRESSYSTILNGVYNQIIGPQVPSSTTFIDEAQPFNNAILNGSYASINGSGITAINDGRYRGGGLGFTNRANYTNSSTIYLDAINGVNIVTGKLTLKEKEVYANQVLNAPSSSYTPGQSGQFSFDSNYFYSHNGIKWRRTALSEW